MHRISEGWKSTIADYFGNAPMTEKPNVPSWGYLALRVGSVIAMCLYLTSGWNRLPNASILLGPLWLVYEFHDLTSCAIALILFAALISPVLKPCVLTGGLAAVAFPLWLVAGVLGEGTEC
jgi:hypothetical protein